MESESSNSSSVSPMEPDSILAMSRTSLMRPSQVMARRGDVGEAFAHALGVVGVHARDGREAHDGVHGRAYVVAHGIEEVALGLRCMLGGLECVLEGLARCELGGLLLRDVLDGDEYVGGKRAGVTGDAERGDLQPSLLIASHDTILALEVRDAGQEMLA